MKKYVLTISSTDKEKLERLLKIIEDVRGFEHTFEKFEVLI